MDCFRVSFNFRRSDVSRRGKFRGGIVMCSQLSAKVVLSDRGGLLPPDTMSDVTAAYAVCAAFLTRRSPSYRVSIEEPTACSTKS